MFKWVLGILLISISFVVASEPIPGKLLIKLYSGQNITSIIEQIPYPVEKYIYRPANFKNQDPEKIYALRFSESEDIKAIAASVKRISGVKWTSLDYPTEQPKSPIKAQNFINNVETKIQSNYIPDTEHWYIRYIPIQQATLVAVIDTGIKSDHKDLKDAIYTNSGEIPGNGIDDDNNGLIDDYQGWNFTGYSSTGGNSDTSPFTSHATLLAGLIGCKKDDKLGIAGVDPDCKIMNIKVEGGVEDAAYAIRYAVDMGAKIINCSWTYGSFTDFIDEAMAYAISHGCIVVVAAGNQGHLISDENLYPQQFPNMTVVTSHTGVERFWSGSTDPIRYGGANYGPEVSFAAYGVDVYTTGLDESKAAEDTGTSLAAPIVSGILSRIWGNNPSLTREQVLAKAIQYTVRLPDSGTGYGRIDSKALAQSYSNIQTKRVNMNVSGKKGVLEVDYVTSSGSTKRFAQYFYYGGRKYSVHREL